MRELWLSIHKWIGLVLGLWILLQGLTGAFLTYKLELQAALDPGLYRTGAAFVQPDLDRISRSLEQRYPNYRIAYFERDGLVANESLRYVLNHVNSGPSPFTDREVFVDPATGTILGDRPWLTFVKAAWTLHTGLIAGRLGEDVVGYLALCLLVSVIVGIILWWPQGKKFAQALRVRPSSPMPRLLRDLHTVCGIYVSALVITSAQTGLVIIFPGSAHAVVGRFADVQPAKTFTTDLIAPGETRRKAGSAHPISLNALAATVEREYPRSTVTLLLYPHNSEKGTYTFRLLPAGLNPWVYTTQIYLSPRDGRILGRFDPTRQPPANSFLGAWAVYLHTGHLGEWPGRIVVLLSGLVLSLIVATGFYIWFKKRGSRRALAKRSGRRSSSGHQQNPSMSESTACAKEQA